jgi:hypothetical protein
MGYGRMPRGYGRRVGAAAVSFAAKRLSGFKRPRAASRVAHRQKRSRTRTSTKRRKGSRSVIGPVAGHDSSSFVRKFRNRFVSRKCLKGAKQYQIFNNGQSVVSTAGRQGVTDFNGQNPGYGNDLASVWQYMAGHTNEVAGGANSTILANNNGSAKIFLHSIKAQYIFTNTSNVGVWLNIYDTTCRKDGDAGDTLGEDGPALAMSLGLTEENYGAVVQQNTVNVTPYQSHSLCVNYKILKVTKVFINPGHIHKHFMTIMLNKWICADDIAIAPLGGGTGLTGNMKVQLRGFTYWPLITFYGAPVHSAGTTTNVSVPAVQLDVVNSRKYEWQLYEYSQTKFNISTDLLTTIADPHTVPEDTAADTAAIQN